VPQIDESLMVLLTPQSLPLPMAASLPAQRSTSPAVFTGKKVEEENERNVE